MLPGYRRRILIEPGPDCVTAELEDDYHRMVVTLRHRDGVIEHVESAMKRAPWTSCPGAMEQLKRTFVGQPIEGIARVRGKTLNCTHLHDLALFAAGHAGENTDIAYDIVVSDPVHDRRRATLDRDGDRVLDWTMDAVGFVAPPSIAGRSPYELNDWIATLDRAGQEAARILRWASMIAHGRQMDIPAHSSADRFPSGTCFTFQPGVAPGARRLAGADIDFSAPGRAPLQNRALSFEKVSEPGAQALG